MAHRMDQLRVDYEGSGLDDVENSQQPFELLCLWLRHATSMGLELPNAMALATSNGRGEPSLRTVLAKHVAEEQGLWFFSDETSHKGRDLKENPRAEGLFYWPPLHRQVRVYGPVTKVPSEAADEYFASRPRESNLSALASHQTSVLEAGRLGLEERREAIKNELDGKELSRPARWVGYALQIERFEFWQGRPDRLHHRLRFVKQGSAWKKDWLSP